MSALSVEGIWEERLSARPAKQPPPQRRRNPARTCRDHDSTTNGKYYGNDCGPIVLAERPEHEGAGIDAQTDGDGSNGKRRGDDSDGDPRPRLIEGGVERRRRVLCRRHCRRCLVTSEGWWWLGRLGTAPRRRAEIQESGGLTTGALCRGEDTMTFWTGSQCRRTRSFTTTRRPHRSAKAAKNEGRRSSTSGADGAWAGRILEGDREMRPGGGVRCRCAGRRTTSRAV